MRMVCISDTHLLRTPEIPDGDLLIHAGDLTMRGSVLELVYFARWATALPHRHKVVIAGNHERCLEGAAGPSARRLLEGAGLVYLEDAAADVAGLRIYGAPWSPEFGRWPFMRPRGRGIAERWELIPASLDVLITHAPPFGTLDRERSGIPLGCEALAEVVASRGPRLHVFGHIHGGYGVVERNGTVFVNASVVNERYRPVNPPVVLDIDESGVALVSGGRREEKE
jgi:hypothetical protein